MQAQTPRGAAGYARLSSWWPWIAGGLAFLAGALVFEEAWPARIALQSPDAPPFFVDGYRARLLNHMAGPALHGFSHDTLLAWLLPLLIYHEVSYLVSTALLALAVACYLRGRGAGGVAAVAGGVAMALSGYHFGLFNPGHRGYFAMMPYAAFLFVLVDRAVAAPRWSQFVLMAVCVGCGLATQPDVFALFAGVAALYTVLRALQSWRRAGAAQRQVLRRGWGWGFGAGALAFAVAGAPMVQRTLTVVLRERERQLAGAGAAEAAPAPDAAQHAAREAWVFATNWSLPLEDALEFIAPNVRGFDSFNPRGPYWGRLGQSLDWPETRQGLPNLRGHAVYLGVLQLLFALFTLGMALPSARPAPSADPAAADRAAAADEAANRGIALFWGGVALAGVLLAFGRHTPLYRLFYSLPLADKMRAPVKFLHLTELAVAVLFGFGVARLTAPAPRDRATSRATLATASVAVLAALACLAGALFFPTEGGTLAARCAALGFPAEIEALLRQRFVAALLHAAALFAVGAVLFAAWRFAPPAAWGRARGVLGWILVAIVLVDMSSVARPYVHTLNVEALYARNPVADALLAEGPPDGRAIAFRLGQRVALRSEHPLVWTFLRHDFALADPPANAGPDDPAAVSRRRFAGDVRRQWLLWGVRAVVVPADALPQLVADAEFELLGTYTFLDGRLLSAPPPSAQLAAVRFRTGPPPAAVFTRWHAVTGAEDAWTALADASIAFDAAPVVVGAPAPPPDTAPGVVTAELVSPPSRNGGRRAVVRVRTDRPGMLVLRARFPEAFGVRATVNGRRQPALPANGFFWAVPVEAGASTVVFAGIFAWWRIGLHALALALALAALWCEGRASRSAP